MGVDLYWRLPEEKRVGADTSNHHAALQRAFGEFPIRLVPHDEHLLRAMAATEPAGGTYEKLTDLVRDHRVVILELK
jgi:hypothetical protein